MSRFQPTPPVARGRLAVGLAVNLTGLVLLAHATVHALA